MSANTTTTYLDRRSESVVRLIARTDAGGCVYATVGTVHAHRCSAWRMGTRHGPCTCGASDLWPPLEREAVELLERAFR